METPIGIGAVISVPSRAAFPGYPAPGLHPLAVQKLHNCMATSPINFNMRMHAPQNMLVDDARNDAARMTLDVGARYLIFFDDDVLMPPHSMKQLIYRMEQHDNIDVCAGVYGHKDRPSFPLIFNGNGVGSYWNWRIGDFIPVTGVGMGLTIIRTTMLEKMQEKWPDEPWFLTERRVSRVATDRNEHFARTEDLYFCDRVLKLDGEIWADCSIIAGHINHGTGEVFEIRFNQDSKPQRKPKGHDAKKRILDLGCGKADLFFQDEGPTIRVDLREEVQPDYRCDLRQLPFTDGYADIVFSSHALEHFGRWEVEDVLEEWLRVLKPGGELRLVLPNVQWAAEQLSNGGGESQDVWNVLYGQQDYPLNQHRMGFTPPLLKDMIERKGLKVKRLDTEGYNIILSATKPRKKK